MIHLFEHEYVGFGFWHGVIDIEQSSQVKAIFEADEHEDIKIGVGLPDGETGLAKQVFFAVIKTRPLIRTPWESLESPGCEIGDMLGSKMNNSAKRSLHGKIPPWQFRNEPEPEILAVLLGKPILDPAILKTDNKNGSTR